MTRELSAGRTAAVRYAVLLGGVLIAPAPGALPAFETLDRNGDGYISEAEARDSGAVTVAGLRDMDADRDQRVSALEYRQYRRRRAHDRRLDATPEQAADARQPGLRFGVGVDRVLDPSAFSALDRNGDGVVQRTEAVASPRIRAARFDDLDLNRDGVLSAREYEEFRLRQRAERRRDATPQ